MSGSCGDVTGVDGAGPAVPDGAISGAVSADVSDDSRSADSACAAVTGDGGTSAVDALAGLPAALSGTRPSHLRLAAAAFDMLCLPPRELSLDCTIVADVRGADVGIPSGPMLLSELRAWLLAHRGAHAASDAVWRELIRRARTVGGEWRLAAVGMAIPRLQRGAAELARGFRGDPADVDAEIVAGVLEAVTRTVDPDRDGLYPKVCWAGLRAGHKVRYADAEVVFLHDLGTDAVAPRLPYGHVDVLLARAVALQVIDAREAALIADTGLDYRPLEEVAADIGVDVAVLRMRRLRAGRRLAEALAAGHLSGTVVSEAQRRRLAAAAAARLARRDDSTAGDAVAGPPDHGTSAEPDPGVRATPARTPRHVRTAAPGAVSIAVCESGVSAAGCSPALTTADG
jgi:hypothetical protein